MPPIPREVQIAAALNGETYLNSVLGHFTAFIHRMGLLPSAHVLVKTVQQNAQRERSSAGFFAGRFGPAFDRFRFRQDFGHRSVKLLPASDGRQYVKGFDLLQRLAQMEVNPLVVQFSLHRRFSASFLPDQMRVVL